MNTLVKRNALTKLSRLFRHESKSLSKRYSQQIEQHVLKSRYEPVVLPKSTINDYLWFNLDRWPDKTAVVCGVTGRGFTYAQLYRMSTSLAASFRTKLKIQDGDCAAIILPNTPEYPCALLGSLQAGCIVTTCNPNYTSSEIKHQLELSNAKVAITSPECYEKVKQACDNLGRHVPILVVHYNGNLPQGAISFAEFAEDMGVNTDCLKAVRREPSDIAILPFSSGTTGLPKGVILTHQNVVSCAKVIEDERIILVEPTTENHQDSFPSVLPFYHIYGLVVTMLGQMSLGCKLITLPSFRPDTFLNSIVNHRSTAVFIVPPIATFLARHPAVKPEHLASFKAITSGAAPLNIADAMALAEKNKNVVIRQGYGLTETAGIISIPDKDDTNLASVGYPVAHTEVAVVKDGISMPTGQQGELWVRGPTVMQGYLGGEGERGVDDEGWHATGDIGYFDHKGYLYITDRVKELIKVKGYQVSPAEVESVLQKHGEVLDVAVAGVKREEGIEEVCAYVVPQQNSKLSPEQLLEHAKASLTDFKVPTVVKFVELIPRSAAGKILRKELKGM